MFPVKSFLLRIAKLSPMNLLICSDLHIECHGDSRTRLLQQLAPADILILAGDIAPVIKPWYEEVISYATSKYPYVIHVLGNHEYWGSSPCTVNKKLHYLQNKNCNYYVLNRDSLTIKDITFAGSTTWFRDSPDARLMQMYMRDFQQIKDFVPWVYEQNERSLEFWETTEADIWISHHAPSNLSQEPKFKGDRLSCYFVDNTLGHLISYKQPKYHVHGHCHNSSSYMINSTQVICNPYGYENSNMLGLNREFRYDLVLDL